MNTSPVSRAPHTAVTCPDTVRVRVAAERIGFSLGKPRSATSASRTSAGSHPPGAANSVSGPYVEAVSTAACDEGNRFRYDAGDRQYVFNLSTKGMTSGTWSLRADLGDGVDHVVRISLR